MSESTQSAESAEMASSTSRASGPPSRASSTDLVAAFGRRDATVSVTVGEDEALEAAVEGDELGPAGRARRARPCRRSRSWSAAWCSASSSASRTPGCGSTWPATGPRRKEALERFARGVAETVKESGVAKALDPMGSADRKVVHDTVNEIDGVATVSEGEEPPGGW